MTGWFWRRLGREDVKRDVEREIGFHLEMRAREFEAQGLDAQAARAAARSAFGDAQDIARECRDERQLRARQRRRVEMWHGVRGDARFALRSLGRRPSFFLAVVLTLGIGVGLVTATASLLNAYLFRALPYPNSDRLVFVQGFGAPDWRTKTDVLERVAAWDLDALSIVSGAQPERVWTSWVTPGFFDVLGIRPAQGRLFTEAEAAVGGARVAIISHGLWQRRWNGDRNVLGQTFSAYSDDRPEEAEVFTIVGVLPPEFWYFNRFTEVLAPLRAERSVSLATLAPRVSVADAQRVLAAQARQRNAQRADVRVIPVREQFTERIRPVLTAIAGAVALVLLLACGNAAALLLVRATGREREFAIRAALGAGRVRLGRQLLIEGLTLAAGAALVGVIAAWLLVSLGGGLFMRIMGTQAPGGEAALRIAGPPLLIALLASTLAALVFALIPQLVATRVRVAGSLVGTRTTDSLRRQRARSVLVAAQVALSLALLIGAGLLVRSARYLERLELGFAATNVGALDLSLRQSTYGDAAARAAFYTQLVARLHERVPGVRVALARSAPFSNFGASALETPERLADSAAAQAQITVTSPEYFQTLGIRLLSGALYDRTHAHASPPVALVSETLARRLWPGLDPLGRRVRVASNPMNPSVPPGPWATVIGVVGAVRKTLTEENSPDLYLPIAQSPPIAAELVMRDPSGRGRLEQVRRAVWSLNPEMPLNEVRWLEDDIAQASLPARFLATVLSGFAAFAVLLANLGLYGLVAYAVAQRRRDIAIRMALGATQPAVVGAFLRQGALLVAAGIAGGVAAGFSLTRLLQGILYGIAPNDGLTYAGVSLLLAFTAMTASWIPARRATRIDPMRALHE
jgi:predicted permease